MTMNNVNGQKALADYLYCLSVLESDTAQLYHSLSDQTEIPLAKTLLLHVSIDSTKHSTILKGITDSLTTSKKNVKDCRKNLGEIWHLVDALRNEVAGKQSGSKLGAPQIMEKLTILESSLGEEYHMVIQMKNLEYLSKEINQFYDVKLDSIRKIIKGIIRDEDNHRELLVTIRRLLEKTKAKKSDNTPIVRFQSPDAWVQS